MLNDVSETPWRLIAIEGVPPHIIDDDGQTLAEFVHIADARLAAQSPALFEALAVCLLQYKGERAEEFARLLKNAEAP